MGENLQWAKEEPKWIENIVDSIYYYMQWKIPLEQVNFKSSHFILVVILILIVRHKSLWRLQRRIYGNMNQRLVSRCYIASSLP